MSALPESRPFRLLSRAAVVALPIVLAACASKPIDAPKPAPVVTATPTPVGSMPATNPMPVAAPSTASDLAAYLDPNSPLSQKRSVWFAFDSATFNASDKPTVELHGSFLAKHGDVHVQIAGNTDERGGSEYNLALGQRRAESVKSALELLGVKDAQVEAVSYGAEKPKASGHDEESWKQNRRADFIYPAR